MTFTVFEYAHSGRRSTIADFDTFDAAEAYVQSLGLVHYERDEDFPGCADAFTNSGLIVHIDQKVTAA